jgi:DNA-binding CsgD family transcriptional regulator
VHHKLRQALEQTRTTAQPEGYELSEREREILVAVARGLTNREIADQYFISIHTVISHRKNITRKTGIKTIAGLTVYALLNNMISEADLGN